MSNLLLDAKLNLVSYDHDYKNGSTGAPVSNWQPLAVTGWKVSDQLTTNFSAQLFKGPDGTYKLAFRGTELEWNPTNLGDAKANTALAMGYWSPEFTDGIRFTYSAIRAIQADNPGLSFDQARRLLSVTGHSQGGAEAELVAKFYGLAGTSLDGPGVSAQVRSQTWNLLKTELRGQQPDLQANYTLTDFVARRYTFAVGSIGAHLSDVRLDNAALWLIGQTLPMLAGPVGIGISLGGQALGFHSIQNIVDWEAARDKSSILRWIGLVDDPTGLTVLPQNVAGTISGEMNRVNVSGEAPPLDFSELEARSAQIAEFLAAHPGEIQYRINNGTALIEAGNGDTLLLRQDGSGMRITQDGLGGLVQENLGLNGVILESMAFAPLSDTEALVTVTSDGQTITKVVNINNNATTGEYHMVVPNDLGETATYTRTLDAQGHFIDRYSQTDASGKTTTAITVSDAWTTTETGKVTYLANAATGERIVVYHTTDSVVGRLSGDVVHTTAQADGGRAVATYDAASGLWLTEKLNAQNQVTGRFTSSDNPLDASDPGRDGVGLWSGGLADFTTADFDAIDAFTGLPDYTRTTTYSDKNGDGFFEQTQLRKYFGSFTIDSLDSAAAAAAPADIAAIQRLNATMAGMETAGLAAAEIRDIKGLDNPATGGASYGLYDYGWLGAMSRSTGRGSLSLDEAALGADTYTESLGAYSPFSLTLGNLGSAGYGADDRYYNALFSNDWLTPGYNFSDLNPLLGTGSRLLTGYKDDYLGGYFQGIGSTYTGAGGTSTASTSLAPTTSSGTVDTPQVYANNNSFMFYFPVTFPVVLDLDGDGVELTSLAASKAWYDTQGDGYRRHTGWIGADDAFLAADLDGDNRITSADELAFARRTAADDTDLQALGTLYDGNHDGVVDVRDANFGQLRVWQDKNGDGISDAGEVRTLSEAGIDSISVNIAKVDYASGGNQVTGFASYRRVDGGSGYAADVALGYEGQGYQVQDRNDGLTRVNQAGGLTFGLARAALTADAAGAGVDGLLGSTDDDILNTSGSRGVMLDGGAGNDQLTGGAGDDWLAGGAGADVLRGGAGNDVLLIDTDDRQADLDGGEGFDIALVTGAAGVTLDLAASNLEAVVGSGGADSFTMTGATRSLQFGKGGDDTLEGGIGADYLDGGTGDDVLRGGGGNDVYAYNRGDGVDEIRDEQIGQVAYQYQEWVSSGKSGRLVTQTGYRTEQIDAGSDTLRFGASISLTDIDLLTSGEDILVKLRQNGTASGDQITLKNQNEAKSRIEFIEFNDDSRYALADWKLGTTGNDTLVGGTANNILNGGQGNDLLQGAGGNDTYIFNRGDGADVIRDEQTGQVAYQYQQWVSSGKSGSYQTRTGYRTEQIDAGSDTLRFGSDIALTDLSLTQSGANILLGLHRNGVATSDQITLKNQNETKSRIEFIEFSDDSRYALAEGKIGTAGNDTLVGGAGNDWFHGGKGNDTLTGGAGNDTYLFNRGDGIDTLVENDDTVGNTDILRMGGGISYEQLWFAKAGNNLDISLIGTSEKVTVRDWYAGTHTHVERIQTADGMALLDSKVDLLVQAMAAFAPPAAGQSTLPDNTRQALAPVFAANWQPSA